MRPALRFRRHDEQARRQHLEKRTPQAGSDPSNVVGDDTDSGFSLTGPITITVFVPPSTTVSSTAVTTSTTRATTTPTATIVPSSSSLSRTSDIATNQPSISVVPSDSEGSDQADTTGAAPVGPNGSLNTGPVLSTGAIVGIIVGIILLLIIGAVILLRRKNLFARKQRRSSWLAKGGIMGPKPIEGYDTILPFTGEKLPPPPQPISPTTVAPPPGPPMPSYSNTDTSAMLYPPLAQPPPTLYGQQPSSSPMIKEEGTPAVVVCTFIPTLADELTIVNGETLRILAEYDDGWGLCVNAVDERGMVPLECLEKKGGSSGVVGPFRSSGSVEGKELRRDSSLAGGPSLLAPNRLA